MSVATVRLLCPRGHFIADLLVAELRDGTVLTLPVANGEVCVGPYFYRWLDEVCADRGPKVDMACRHRRCSYRGSFDYFTLGSAVAGHAEHRLTN